MGLKTLFKTDHELGFYSGCNTSGALQARCTRITSCPVSRKLSSKRMDDLLKKYPISDPENDPYPMPCYSLTISIVYLHTMRSKIFLSKIYLFFICLLDFHAENWMIKSTCINCDM